VPKSGQHRVTKHGAVIDLDVKVSWTADAEGRVTRHGLVANDAANRLHLLEERLIAHRL
jgi:hypothetical protein